MVMIRYLISLSLLLFFCTEAAFSDEKLDFTGLDTPNDKGSSMDLSWTVKDLELKKKALNIFVFRKKEGSLAFDEVKQLDISTSKYTDKKALEDNIKYFYYLVLKDSANNELYKSETFGPYISSPQWFNTEKIPVLIAAIVSIIIILSFIHLAKAGKKFYIRPLHGVTAIEEAVGRATEMGKPCIYLPGISSIADIATLASISIVSKIAETVAEYNSRLIIPNFDPIVYSVIDEVVKTAYIKAGRPDSYNADDVYYLTGRQFAYAAGIAGLMAREKPAANFFLGWFMAESLILAESGAMTGAIQVAGTDSVSQIPFFIVACDYTLIGEELYAAGAYMGNDAKLIGGLKGQDYVKLCVMITIIILFLLNLFGVPGITNLLTQG